MPKRIPATHFSAGDYFAIPLPDGTYIVAQVLDLMMKNIVSVALLTRRHATRDDGRAALASKPAEAGEVFSALSTWRDPLDEGKWPILGHGQVLLPRSKWPNEEFRSKKWVGAKHFNTALVEDFVAAMHGLRPWDALFDPAFYDRLLIDPAKKPVALMYSKTRPASSTDCGA